MVNVCLLLVPICLLNCLLKANTAAAAAAAATNQLTANTRTLLKVDLYEVKVVIVKVPLASSILLKEVCIIISITIIIAPRVLKVFMFTNNILHTI